MITNSNRSEEKKSLIWEESSLQPQLSPTSASMGHSWGIKKYTCPEPSPRGPNLKGLDVVWTFPRDSYAPSPNFLPTRVCRCTARPHDSLGYLEWPKCTQGLFKIPMYPFTQIVTEVILYALNHARWLTQSCGQQRPDPYPKSLFYPVLCHSILFYSSIYFTL